MIDPRKIMLLMSIAVAVCFSLNASATIYYVEGSNLAANDSNPGTEALPLKTIQKGVDKAIAGDKVYVKAGIYPENIVLKNSGTEGNPIVIEGQRGTDGEFLTVVDSSFRFSDWNAAPEIGAGVYKAKLGNNPGHINLGGKQLGRLADSEMTEGTGFNYLKAPIDYDVNLMYVYGGLSKVKFWDAVYGVFGTLGDTTYIRLKDGSNPNDQVIRVGRNETTGFRVYSHSGSTAYVIIRNFKIGGMEYGMILNGENNHHIVVEDNLIINARRRIQVSGGISDVTIRRNELTMNFYGFTPGAWGSSSEYESGLRQFIYTFYKYTVGESDSDDTGIFTSNPGNRIEIYNNYIHDGLIGLGLSDAASPYSTGNRVYGNRIVNHSSVGITMMYGVLDTHIFDNNIINSNINLRIHQMDNIAPREYYVFDNNLHNPIGRGTHVFIHWFTNYPRPPLPIIYFYHNSISGGHAGIYFNAYSEEYGGVPGMFVFNNIFNSGSNLYGMHPQSYFGYYNYNWVGKAYATGTPPVWFGSNNIRSDKDFVGDFASGFDVNSNAWSEVFGRGLDLSRAQDINGKTIGPLPGITGDYYCGSAPDIGAVQYCPIVTGCGDGICAVGETPASCAADCNSGAVNCGTKGKFCSPEEYCSGGICIKSGCPAPPIDFAKLKTYEGSWLNRIISMAEFMAKILEWKKCSR